MEDGSSLWKVAEKVEVPTRGGVLRFRKMTPTFHLPPTCEYCGAAMKYESGNIFVCGNGHPPHRVFIDGTLCACPKCDEKRNG